MIFCLSVFYKIFTNKHAGSFQINKNRADILPESADKSTGIEFPEGLQIISLNF